MSLKFRFLSSILGIGLLTLLFSILALSQITDSFLHSWAEDVLDREFSHNQERTIQPLIEEVQKVSKIAISEPVQNWATSPEDNTARDKAINYLNRTSDRLRANSYFISFKDNGGYYFNNSAGEYTGRELRYRLDPNNRSDAWFYTSLEQHSAYNLNIDFDRGIQKLMLWINVQIKSGDKTQGIIGTGFEIDLLLSSYLEDRSENYTTFFLDTDGAIQLSSGSISIEMGAVSKSIEDKRLIYDYVTSYEESSKFKEALSRAKNSPGQSEVLDLSWNGRQHIVQVNYLSELNWYHVVAVNPQDLVDSSIFYPIYLMLIIGNAVILGAIYYLLVRQIDRPLNLLTDRIDLIHSHKEVDDIASLGLPLEFNSLAKNIESFALFDPLTNLYNKRGMQLNLERDFDHCKRNNQAISIIVFDLDHFKNINDTYGHTIGDKVLITVCNRLTEYFARATDSVARFGGEEFVVTIVNADEAGVKNRVEAFRSDIRSLSLVFGPVNIERRITVSAGAVTLSADAIGKFTSQQVFDFADAQLYEAKNDRDTLSWNQLS